MSISRSLKNVPGENYFQVSPRGHHLYLTLLKVNFEERLKLTFVAHLIKSSGYVTVDETIPAKAPAVSRNNGRCSLGS